MKRAVIVSLILITSVSILLGIIYLNTIHKSNTTGGVSYIYLREGSSGFGQLKDSLISSGRVINIRSFERAANFYGATDKIKPGRYEIVEGMSNKQLIRTFRLGLQKPVNLVLSGNIRTLERLSAILSSRLGSDSLSFIKTFTSEDLVDSLGFNSETFPAIFLLNTYQVYWTIKPKELVTRMKSEYERFWNSERREKATSLGLSPVEVTILASIVAEESNLRSEHPVIAGVYINRLRRGMPLQADPTIKFALNDPSIKRILFRHLEINSPYNTYKYRGLPPGPITLPTPHIIDSVLNYKEHNYLYFCANASLDGSHLFASTLSQHNRNARAYQSAISGRR